MDPIEIHYYVRLSPIGGEGAINIEDVTVTRPGESAEECVRREAKEAGWNVLEIFFAKPLSFAL